MKVLITGNLGYVGPVLIRHLKSHLENVSLLGYDTGYFSNSLTTLDGVPERYLTAQYFGDVRNLSEDMFKGVDAVVHLAAISNDPMGNQYESVTYDINLEASKLVAKLAKSAGVSKFVFASSCSMYGAASDKPKTELDAINPLTAYAKSKAAFEEFGRTVASPDFNFIALRFATACGMSPRLRLDLVLNDFVAGALAEKKIQILSDGTPWRPLIHVSDMARAIEWAITNQLSEHFLAVNTGSNGWNYQVRDLAYAVRDLIGGIDVSINPDAVPDKRSYQVDFSKYMSLAPNHQPKVSLQDAIVDLQESLGKVGFVDADFRNSELIRLKTLNNLKYKKLINEQLYWI